MPVQSLGYVVFDWSDADGTIPGFGPLPHGIRRRTMIMAYILDLPRALPERRIRAASSSR